MVIYLLMEWTEVYDFDMDEAGSPTTLEFRKRKPKNCGGV
jgi:hypothetical protein